MMKRLVLALGFVATLAVAVAMAADDAKEEAIKKDRRQIHGTWQAVSMVAAGLESTPDEVKTIKVVNGDDGTWALLQDGKATQKGTSTFDPTKSPKEIDFTITEGDGKGEKFTGIYELGENSRKMCFSIGGKRPTEFSSKPGSNNYLMIFERAKE